MKYSRSVATFAFAMALLQPVQAEGQAGEVLNNQSVVQMVTGKVPKALIITKVQSTATAFDIGAAALVALHTNKVPDDVVKQMIIATKVDPKEVLTNTDIVLMVTGSVGKDLILMKVNATKGNYDLSATGLVSLQQNKVSQDIMKAMMAPTPPEAPSAPKPVSPPTRGGGGGRSGPNS